jgi:CBS domain-containing protein
MDNSRVEDVMTREVITVDVGATIAEALDLLQRQEIRHLPVIRDGEVVGMLSDRDLRALGIGMAVDDAQLERLRAKLSGRVSDLMSGNLVSVGPQDDLRDVVERMLDAKVGAVPVIDDDTEDLVGIVSYVDLLRLLRDALDEGE